MSRFFSQDRFCCLRPVLDGGSDGGGDYGYGGGGYGGSGGYSGGGGVSTPVYTTNIVTQSPVPAPVQAQAPRPAFDLSASSIAGAAAKGNKQSDIMSAYQTFITGVPTGRGGQYAVDAQRRYGYGSIQEAAAAYLDAAGLRRLAETLTIIDPEPAPDGSGLRTTREEIRDGDSLQTLGSQEELFLGLPNRELTDGRSEQLTTLGELVKVFERVFETGDGSESPAPVVVVGDATDEPKSGGGNLGIILAVLVIGAGAVYWFYLRKKGTSNAS